MSRKALEVKCSDADINYLNSVIENPLSSATLIDKCKTILFCNNGLDNKDIARMLNRRENTIGDWRRKFINGGIDALIGPKPCGRAGKAHQGKRKQIRETFLNDKNSGIQVDAKMLADKCGTTVSTVHRALKEEGLVLNRKTIWEAPLSGLTKPKACSIAGLYLGSDADALVIGSASDAHQMTSQGISITANSQKAVILSEKDTLLEAIDCLTTFTNQNIARSAQRGIQDYLNNLVSLYSHSNNIHFHVFILFRTDAVPILKKGGITATIAKDENNWLEMIKASLSILSGADAGSITEQISQYCAKHRKEKEPLTWNMSTSNKEQDKGLDLKHDLPESANSILTINACYCNKEGVTVKKEISLQNPIPELSSIDYSNPLAFGSTVGQVEKGIAEGMRTMTKQMVEGLMAEAVKKKRTDGLKEK